MKPIDPPPNRAQRRAYAKQAKKQGQTLAFISDFDRAMDFAQKSEGRISSESITMHGGHGKHEGLFFVLIDRTSHYGPLIIGPIPDHDYALAYQWTLCWRTAEDGKTSAIKRELSTTVEISGGLIDFYVPSKEEAEEARKNNMKKYPIDKDKINRILGRENADEKTEH